METRPSKSTHKTYAYLDLEFLLQEAPSILGERSNMGGFISALTSGGPGMSVASSDEHHDHLIERLKLDTPGQNLVQKYRALQTIWVTLEAHSKHVLVAYYTPRVRWPLGFEAFIGPELSSVALTFPPDGNARALREACLDAANHEALILRARNEALDHIREAHADWDDARRIVSPPKPLPQSVRNSLDEFRRRAS